MSIYIGYDLGDGDTSVVIYSSDRRTGKWEAPKVQKLPHMEKGEALPSIVGKDDKDNAIIGAYALLGSKVIKFEELSINFKRMPTTLSPEELDDYRKQVVLFTDVLFSQLSNAPDQGLKTLCEVSQETDVVISVGHPTTWSDEDIALYRDILSSAKVFSRPEEIFEVDGITTKLQLHPESKAALMSFVNQKKENNHSCFSVEDVPPDASIAVFDFGSSTSDVTILINNNGAIETDEELLGDPNLGARYIDRAIYEKILEMSEPDDQTRFRTLLKHNPALEAQCIYYCRLAKQTYYNALAVGPVKELWVRGPKKVGFELEDFFAEDSGEIMNRALMRSIPELAGKTIRKSYENLIQDVSKVLSKNNKTPAFVFLTGGASRMSFIPELARKAFPTSQVILDPEPAHSIAYGLAYLPRKLKRAEDFLEQVEAFGYKRIPVLIHENESYLADALATTLSNKILDVAKNEILRWKRGTYSTLSRMERGLNEEVESVMGSSSTTNAINSDVRSFIKNKLAPVIQDEFTQLCKTINVSSGRFKTENTSAQISRSSLNIDVAVAGTIINEIDAALEGKVKTLLGATLALIVAPIVLTIVASLSIPIVTALCNLVIGLLTVIPGGQLVLLAIAAVGIAYLFTHGIDAVKKEAVSRVRGYEIPLWVRKFVSDDKIDEIISRQRSDIKSKLKSRILNDDKFKSGLSGDVGKALGEVIKKIGNDLALKIQD